MKHSHSVPYFFLIMILKKASFTATAAALAIAPMIVSAPAMAENNRARIDAYLEVPHLCDINVTQAEIDLNNGSTRGLPVGSGDRFATNRDALTIGQNGNTIWELRDLDVVSAPGPLAGQFTFTRVGLTADADMKMPRTEVNHPNTLTARLDGQNTGPVQVNSYFADRKVDIAARIAVGNGGLFQSGSEYRTRTVLRCVSGVPDDFSTQEET